jgi:hypothetical protein
VPEQDLHGAEISGLLVDDGRFGPPQRVRPVILPTQANASDPLVDKTSVLPSADMGSVVGSAREGKVFERATPALKPSKDARAGRFQQFELNGSASLSLDNNRSEADLAAADEISNLHLNNIAAA